MQQMEAEPRKGYILVYGIYQSCTSSEEFFKRLCKELLESSLYSKLNKRAKTVYEKAASLVGAFTAIEGFGVKVELDAREGLDWSEKFQNLLGNLNTGNEKLVIMIDEFPEVVEQIIKKDGKDAARTFLHRHREIRQDPAYRGRVQFMYTGSIGILNTVFKTGDTKVVNDIYQIPIGPLSNEEAMDMAEKILKHYGYRIHKAELEYLVSKLDWLIPFHIKLLLEYLRDLPKDTTTHVEEGHIDRAFTAICTQENIAEFQHYFGRIPLTFGGKEKEFAFQSLALLANETALGRSKLFDLAMELGCEEQCDTVLHALEVDGYIHVSPAGYQFRSIILKSWWKRHEARKLY